MPATSPCSPPTPENRLALRLDDAVLREESVRRIKEALAPLPARRTLVLDMECVDLLTAGGLGGLISLHHGLRAVDGRLVLVNVGSRAYEVFEVTRLTEILDVRPFWEGEQRA
jgi:anti-anti-sigma factor